MKKKTLFFSLSILFGLVLFYITYSKLGISNVLENFKNFTLGIFMIYLFAVTMIEMGLVFRWNIILRSFGMKVPFHKLFLYKMSGYTIGYLSPQAHVGGEPVRALLLKRHGISFNKGIGTIVIDKTMTLTTDVIMAVGGAIALFLHFSVSNDLKFLVFGFIAFIAVLLVLYFYCMIAKKPFFSAIFHLKIFNKSKKMQDIKDWIMTVEDTINTFYTKHFKAFMLVVLVNFLLYALMFVEFGSAITLFGFKPSFYVVFVLMGSVALSYSMPVPMALGVLEASQASALGAIKLNPAIGLSVSLLVRIKDIIRMIIGGITLFYFGMDFKTIWKEIKKNDKAPA